MIKYRSDIDGLRAIAVLAVLFYHADIGISGGFVGVDIFFVISGYLITKIIISDLEKNKFSFLNFWERRVRRILPALLLVVITTIFIGFFVQFSKEYRSTCASVMWITAFSSNIYFWRNTGDYFDGSSLDVPLLHTWSLSLEEQFYIVLPILLWIIFRYLDRKILIRFFLTMIALSFLISIWGVKNYEIATFFLLPTRAWELAAGSLIVFASPLKNKNHIIILSWIGFLCVVLPILFYSKKTEFPGYNALPPVIGSLLIIWTGIIEADIKKVSIIHRFLSIKPLVWIGLISYSLYLWHWPLLSYSKYLSIWDDNIFNRALILLISFIIAVLSFRFIERPFRTKKILKSRRVLFTSILAGMSAIFLFTLSVMNNEGIMKFNNNNHLRLLSQLTNNQKVRHDVNLFPPDFGVLGDSNQKVKVLFIGDSHCGALAPMLDSKLKDDKISGRYIAASGDPLLNGFKRSNGNMFYINRLVEHISVDDSFSDLTDIVLIARWQYYLYHEPDFYDNIDFYGSLRSTIEELKKLDCNIHIMIQVPEFTDIPKLHLRASWPFRFKLDTLKWEGVYPEYQKIQIYNSHQRQIEIFEEIYNEFDNVRIMNPLPLMLSKQNKYQMFENDISIYSDHNHLSIDGANKIKSLFEFK